jgi:serine/threonine-protein kinase
VHRDIKPDNILLDATTGRTMVTDFGIARAVSDADAGRLTATGMAIGTPAYMSPEQAAGDREIDGRSDLYSLGVVTYQMLVGEPPFTATSTPAILVKHISERPIPVTQRRSDVPQDLARAVMMCLEKEPGMRFPSASALVTALDTGHVPERRPSPEAGALMPVHAGPVVVSEPAYGSDATFSAEELRRFKVPEVVKFRRKVAPYLFVNAVIVIAAIFGDRDWIGITVLWSIYLAFKYAKLWSEGYDWRDVFKQPREKELIDVADEFTEYTRAMFNREKRHALREKNRARNVARRSSGASSFSGLGSTSERRALASSALSGPNAERVRRAAMHRDEIVRLVDTLPDRDRARVAEVLPSADALMQRVEGLAIALVDLDRNVVSGGGAELEAEINRLEDLANPLESGSEDRVRRLAYLKRQRRSVKDMQERRNAAAAKLETCSIALENLKLDMLRLRAGSQSHQHVTSLALQAMSLAEDVDSALFIADEVARVTDRPAADSSRYQRQSAR